MFDRIRRFIYERRRGFATAAGVAGTVAKVLPDSITKPVKDVAKKAAKKLKKLFHFRRDTPEAEVSTQDIDDEAVSDELVNAILEYLASEEGAEDQPAPNTQVEARAVA